MAVTIWMFSANSTYHIHHYFIGLVMVVFTGETGPVSAAINAVGTVFFVEGASHYGFDPHIDFDDPFVLTPM